MKRTVKMISGLLCFVMMSILLAACGGGGESGAASSPDPGNSSGTQGKQKIKVMIGSGYTPEGAPWTKVVKEFFVPEVNKALEGTNYEIEWTELYGGTVAKSGEELEAVESGLLDMAFVVSPSEPSALPVSNIGYNVPFSSSDPAIVNKAVNAILEKYPELSAEYEKANQKVLAMGVTESYNMISKTPFTKIEELKGKKVGAVGSNLKWVEPTGAALVQSPLPEVYQQLSTGVFEAYVIYPSSAYGYKLYEQAKYYIQTGFGCAIIGALTVNKNTWEKFPEEVQKAILEVASQYSQKLVEENIKLTKESFEKMQQEGAVITELSEEEKAKWVQLVSDVPNQYAQKLNELGLPGTEIVRDYIQAQIDAGHKFPAEYVIN